MKATRREAIVTTGTVVYKTCVLIKYMIVLVCVCIFVRVDIYITIHRDMCASI